MSFSIRRRKALMPALLVLLVCSAGWAQSDSSSVLRRADENARAGRWDAARDGYADALRRGASLEQDANRAELVALAYANASPADLSSAIRWFQTAVRLSGDERVRAELADTQVRAGKYDDAAEQYQILAKAHPASAIYMIALSRALLQSGRAEDALQALQPWLARSPGTTSVRLEYARILSYQKHFADARQQYETVLKSEPTNLVAQIGVAKVTSWQGDQETALPMYERVLARNPTNYDALVGKAFCLVWMGRQPEALPLLQTAIRRNPSDADVREALSHITGAAPLPPVAAAPPSLPEVPAAAPYVQREAAASPPRETAPRITVLPPTALPQVTPAQRSAGTRSFVPKGSKQQPAAPKAAKANARKNPAPAGKAEASTPAEEDDSKPQPETNVFGFNGMSNAKIVIILTVLVGVLMILLFTLTSRDSSHIETRHERIAPKVVKISRTYRPEETPAPPTTKAAPAMRATVASEPEPAMAAPAPKKTGDYTLSGIPRSDNEPQPRRNSAPPAQLRRPAAPPPAAAPKETFATEIMPRVVAESMMMPTVRLNGLRVLLVGAREKLVEFERVALQGAGAEVMVETNWSKAIDRMTSSGVHAIVLNEDGGDQTRRIYQSVATQYPGWLKRILLVLAEDDVPTQHFIATCQSKCLMEPFQSAEFVNKLGAMFGKNAKAAQ
jgi:tetratricopeptide (TPR) repeat protein